MNIRSILIILAAALLISCGKRTEVKGIVYSYRNVPVPNARVAYEEHRQDVGETYWNIATTNDKGEYSFSFKADKHYNYFVKCYCDSGYNKQAFSVGQANKVDLHLE
jgi:hypothetical protein